MLVRPWLPLHVLVLGSLAFGCTELDEPTRDEPTQQDTLPVNPAPGPRASSGFEQDADGWTVTGDAQEDHVEPDYSGQGGNPDGLISAVDDATGGVWYFQAPAKYLGDASGTYGRALNFDLRTNTVSRPFESFDIVLRGASLILGFDASPNPSADVWNEYSIRLDESAGWVVATSVSEEVFADFESLPAPTRAQMRAVLGDLTQLLIRGEFQDGEDTGSLDNVQFGADE